MCSVFLFLGVSSPITILQTSENILQWFGSLLDTKILLSLNNMLNLHNFIGFIFSVIIIFLIQLSFDLTAGTFIWCSQYFWVFHLLVKTVYPVYPLFNFLFYDFLQAFSDFLFQHDLMRVFRFLFWGFCRVKSSANW